MKFPFVCMYVCIYSTFELSNKWTSFYKIFNENSAIRCHLNLIESYFNFLLQSADDLICGDWCDGYRDECACANV